MPTTTYFDATIGARAIGLRTDNAGSGVSPDLTAEEDRYESADISQGFVAPSDAFEVTEATVWNVNVGSGATDVDVYAVAGADVGQGTYIVRLDQAGDVVTITAADGSNPRIDEIYLVVVDNIYDAGGKSLPRLAYREGTADASPSAPGPDAAWDAFVILATIDLPTAAADILACTITDERTISQLVVDAPTLEGMDSTEFSVDGHLHDADYAQLSHVGSESEHPDATVSASGLLTASDMTKLDGIEASADVNETDAELLVTLKTVDGAGSGLDADLLDGLHLASYGLSGHNHNSRYYTESEQDSFMGDKAPKTERVKAYKNVNQSIANLTVSDVLLQAETVDDWGGHGGSNAFVSDDAAGYYLFIGQVQFAASSGGDMRQVDLWHSTAGIIGYARTPENGAGDAVVIQVMTVFKMTGSQSVRMRAYQDSGGNLNVEPTQTWLEMVKL